MPRIRTLKPEFWGSPSHRHADPWVRLFFQSMWNWADDSGRGTANPRELAAFAFPDDEDPTVPTVEDVPRLLLEVHKRYDVVFYKVDGRRYYEIPSWDRHQRNERRAASRHPGPTDGAPYDPGPPDGVPYTESRKFRDSAAEAPRRASGGPPQGPRRAADRPSFTTAPEHAPDDLEMWPADGSDQPLQATLMPEHGTSVFNDGSSVAGTGNREPGNRGTGEPGACSAAPGVALALVDADASGAATRRTPAERTPNQRAKALADIYCKLVPLTEFMAVRGVVKKAIDADRYTDEQIEAGLRRVAADKWPLKANTLRIAIEGLPKAKVGTVDIIAAGRDLVSRYEAEEAEECSTIRPRRTRGAS